MGMAKQSDPSGPGAVGVPVLVTRPLAEAQGFAAALSERFGDRVCPVVAPLMAIRFLSPPVRPGAFSGLIFTSVHGVEAARRLGLTGPATAYCVGRKTSAAARASGFDAMSADGDADALFSSILGRHRQGRLLHVRGREARGDLEARLTSAGIATESLIAYHQEPLPLAMDAARLLRRDIRVVVTLFSPRTAALFAAALPSDAKASLCLAVMSPAVSAALSRLSTAVLKVAARPDAESMLDAVAVLLGPGPAP